MPIPFEALALPGDRYVALRGGATLREAFAYLASPPVSGQISWILLTLRSSGDWALARFDTLRGLALRQPGLLDAALDDLDALVPARVVDRLASGMAHADREALRSAGRLLVVTERGRLAGVLFVAVRGGKPLVTQDQDIHRLIGQEPTLPATRNLVPMAGEPDKGARRPPSAGTEIRYIDISCPSCVWRGTPRFSAVIRLTITDPELGENARALKLDPGRPVQVHLRAETFVPLNATVQEVALRPGEDSPPLVFDLRPLEIGIQRLCFDFFQGSHPLGEVAVTVEVRPERVAESPESLVRRELTLEQEPPLGPDRVLLVDWSPERSELSLALMWDGGSSWRRFPPITVRGDLEQWARRFFGDLVTLTRGADPIARKVLGEHRPLLPHNVDQRLEMVGRNLWNCLPPEFRDFYRDERQSWHDKSLLIFSDEPFLPWELMRPYGPGWEDEDPWCLSLSLSRWLRQDAMRAGNPGPPGRLPFTTLACLAPRSFDLPGAEQEKRFLQNMIRRRRLRDLSPGRVTWEATLSLFDSGGYDWLHVAAHGNFYSESPDQYAALWMEDEQGFSPQHLVGPKVEDHLRHTRPAFFLNACDAARLGWSWNGLEGWADRLLALGAGMFLGPLWVAEDAAALNLARSFYKSLLAGDTVAESLRSARREAMQPGNPTWLAYSLYAHPNARLHLER